MRERDLSDIKLEVSTTTLDEKGGLMFTTNAKRETKPKKEKEGGGVK